MRTGKMTGLNVVRLLAALGGIVGGVGLCHAQRLSTPSTGTSPAQAPVPSAAVLAIRKPRTELKIVQRFSRVLELKKKITRVDGFDPAVINVTALSAHRIRVQALTSNITTMVVTDETGETFRVDVFVTGDVRYLQAYLRRLFPRDSVEAVPVRDSILLRGWVMQPEHITRMIEIAEQFYPKVLNQMDVGGPQQVMLKVKVMEVQRTRVRKLGFNFLYSNKNGVVSSTPGSLTPLSMLSVPLGGIPSAAVSAAKLADTTIAGGIVDNSNSFQGFLEALKEEKLLKILAEPTLTANNGRPANMLSGGEFPILVPQSLGTTTIEWRDFGVRLEAVPIILGHGRVRLELQPEVSERDFTNSVTIQGLTVPGLTSRRVNTQVTMKFGQTFVLAGLISHRDTADTAKVPFLGELPWIGAAFRRVRHEEGETELVIMVTPELAGPLRRDQIPHGGPGQFTTVPTDRELFRDGFIEVPNYGGYNPEVSPSRSTMSPVMTDPARRQSVPAPPAPGASTKTVLPPPRTPEALIAPPQPKTPPAAPKSSAIRSGGPSGTAKGGSAARRQGLFRISRRIPFPRRAFRFSKAAGTVPPQRPVELRDTRFDQSRPARQSAWKPTSPATKKTAAGPGLIEPTPGLIKPNSSVTPPNN